MISDLTHTASQYASAILLIFIFLNIWRTGDTPFEVSVSAETSTGWEVPVVRGDGSTSLHSGAFYCVVAEVTRLLSLW